MLPVGPNGEVSRYTYNEGSRSTAYTLVENYIRSDEEIMPTSINFEDAVNRIMAKAKLDRADAIEQIRGLRDDGTLDENMIPDLNHGLAYESMASMGHGFPVCETAYRIRTMTTWETKFADIVGWK